MLLRSNDAEPSSVEFVSFDTIYLHPAFNSPLLELFVSPHVGSMAIALRGCILDGPELRKNGDAKTKTKNG